MPEAQKNRTLIATIPRRRSQEERRYSDGSREIRCYSPANPHYFKDGAGVLRPIDMAVEDSKTSKIGPSKLRSRNVVSAGIRADGGLDKLVGLRPDFSQDKGDHQLEFTLVRVEVDGVDQGIASKISAPVASAKDSRVWDMGRFQVIPNRRFCRQAVLIDRPKTGFRIEFLLHVKGLTISPVKATGRPCWHVRDASGEVDWMITEPLLLDENLEVIQDEKGVPYQNIVIHSLIDNGDGTFTYVKESVKGADFSVLPDRFWVDASTVYSSTADGHILGKSCSTWADARTDSYLVNDTYTDIQVALSGSKDGSNYKVNRAFLYFDTSALSGSVQSADLCVTSYYVSSSDISDAYVQEGTQDSPLSTSDFNNFTGSAFSSQINWGYSAGTLNTISLNSSGIAALNLGGTTKYCLREEHDYEDHQPSEEWYCGMYFADYSGTTYDPYLSITFATTVTKTVSFDALIKKSGIAQTASIDALIQKQIAKSVSIDAKTQKSQAITAIIDALLQSPRAVSAVLGAILVKHSTSSAIGDHPIGDFDLSVFGGASNVFLDAAVQQSGISTGVSLDAAVQKTSIRAASVDAILTKIIGVSTSMDAKVQKSQAVTAIVDALLQSPRAVSVLMDAALQKTQVCNILMDALVVNTETAMVLIDAALQAPGAAAVILDALIQAGHDVSAAMDALLVVVGTQSIIGLDGVVVWPGRSFVGLGAVVGPAGYVPAAVCSVRVPPQSRRAAVPSQSRRAAVPSQSRRCDR